MRFEGFEIFTNEGEPLETLSAILVAHAGLTLQPDGAGGWVPQVAVVTAQVPPDTATVTFLGNGQGLATVDAVDGKAILELELTCPGTLTVRAGEPTISKQNEVTIHAVG